VKMRERSFDEMIGLVPVCVDQTHNEITFRFADGTAARFYHEQQCYECVEIEDVCGDWSDLIGRPLLVATERRTESQDTEDGSETWTFYTFRGVGGSVDVRWYGTSNGWYSERVDFEFLPAGAAGEGGL
jgi:hypothetical protein